jgi:hypothetical protein
MRGAAALVVQRARAGAHCPHPRGRGKPVAARATVRATAGMAREGAPRVVARLAADAAVVIGAGLAGLLGLAAGRPPDEQSDENHQGHFEGEDQPDRRAQRTGNPRARRPRPQMGTAWSLRGVRTRTPLVHDTPGRRVRARLCGREPTARARPGSRLVRGDTRSRAHRCSIAAPQRGRVGGRRRPDSPACVVVPERHRRQQRKRSGCGGEPYGHLAGARPSLPSRAAVG